MSTVRIPGDAFGTNEESFGSSLKIQRSKRDLIYFCRASTDLGQRAVTYIMESATPAVARALDLLEILGRSNQGLTLSELSRELGIPKSTTHYIIGTLSARGYLQRAPWSRQYSLAARAFEFRARSGADSRLMQISSRGVNALAESTSLGAQVSVLDGNEGLVIARANSRPQPTGGTGPGYHFHLHCTAAGKVLLAWMNERVLETFFLNQVLAKFTCRTITNFEGLRDHLRDVRGRGFAINHEEYHVNRRAIAVPIISESGRAIAAISVDGMSSQILASRVPQLAEQLYAASRELSRELAAS
ncbi:MAG: IclR family transcriptional regulator [Candidatus Acidiferrales bacterium]